MTRSSHYKTGPQHTFRALHRHLARALIGQSVELLVDAHTIVQGIVSGVLTEAGHPKLVVDGSRYELHQILTAIPATLGQPLQTQH